MDQLERQHARRVLDHVGGNKARAAQVLGISRTHLYQLLKKSGDEEQQSDSDAEDLHSQGASVSSEEDS
jgi:DNA-binding NtrC family response regulator